VQFQSQAAVKVEFDPLVLIPFIRAGLATQHPAVLYRGCELASLDFHGQGFA
jgi:hypothetical protein